ncbi:tRNA (adenosine(37)-N6)-threonylcarbamoyltransferase complex ATPase subunit type 1 TsaE [Bacillus sp. HMF5848]|uniref:tRNA (adenosine(37)-N6)-threonylcarbamoyltransferase complex ATPase subunit type 1 TsaE n=1 Tax=Bacillus sp. HMF5848 TaxID=2495421 RepID=UPI000F7882EB|nr:tRNA (adenosine(37)-N6)-threonylcarbamoyltransferase complex ATPase subunit type 1 TsaE [Bacillus sp. HMF5848]RSK25672.1 tRNA (adenosine(37)-N6)-threonylcarbamoyltransferase complex ATPase subunit type 1 TsaE [Bacillus sp. HMF5848]
MSVYFFTTTSPEETMTFSKKLAAYLQPGDVITLEGDLGAGKTTFVKGLAKGLNITRNVNSPTFTIIKEYQGKMPLYHMDVYRMEESDEDLGFEEYFSGSGITVVEWPQFIKDFLPEALLKITIKHTGENARKIQLEPIGSHFENLCKEIIQ